MSFYNLCYKRGKDPKISFAVANNHYSNKILPWQQKSYEVKQINKNPVYTIYIYLNYEQKSIKQYRNYLDIKKDLNIIRSFS